MKEHFGRGSAGKTLTLRNSSGDMHHVKGLNSCKKLLDKKQDKFEVRAKCFGPNRPNLYMPSI